LKKDESQNKIINPSDINIQAIKEEEKDDEVDNNKDDEDDKLTLVEKLKNRLKKTEYATTTEE